MVSLERKFRMNTGAQRLDDTTNGSRVSIDDGIGNVSGIEHQELLNPVLASNDEGAFKKLQTIPWVSVHILVSVTISLIGILLAAAWPIEKRCEAYFIMMYLRASFWLITFIFDHIIKKHHDTLRLNGYHEFHRSAAVHKSVPLLIVSFWNSMLLGVQAFIHHYYGLDFWQHCEEGFLSPVNYIVAFHLSETLVLAVTHGNYTCQVIGFNRSAQPPDALRGANSASGFLGLMQPGGNITELLEKQADLIAYLKDHNQKLKQKLHEMQLTSRTVNISRQI